LSVALGRDVVLCLESARLNEIRLQVEFLKGIYPPINKGDILGSYNIFMADKLIKEVPLVAGEDSIGNPLDFSGTLNLFINKALDIMDIKG